MAGFHLLGAFALAFNFLDSVSRAMFGRRCEARTGTVLSVVPTGLESFFGIFPALKCWVKLVGNSGAGICELRECNGT